MNDTLRSVFVGTSGLTVAAAVALALTVYRAPVSAEHARQNQTTALVVACLTIQVAHFIEEYTTRFYQRFPSLVGLVPWSVNFFVVFNVFWLIIWAFSALALSSGARIALFPLWFLAVSMIANGIAHPLLAVASGGYFPGLITAPIEGILGVALWMRLMRLTRRTGQTPSEVTG
jgi:hypothetical protein